MSLSEKIINAKRGKSLFDDVPPERMYALKKRAQAATAIFTERKRRGLSQAEFAVLCGVTQAMVSKWESGECNFTLEKWAELTMMLDLPFDPVSVASPHCAGASQYKVIFSRENQYRNVKTPNIIDFSAYREEHYSDKEN